jgi:hypothetical protein
MAKKKNSKTRKRLSKPRQVNKAVKRAAKKSLSKPRQVNKAVKRAAKSGGKVSRKEIKQISKASKGTATPKKIAQLVKKANVKGPSKVRAIAKKARGKKLKGIKNTTPIYNNLPKYDPKKVGTNIPKYVAAPKNSKKPKGNVKKPKGNVKKPNFGLTIEPLDYNKKKFDPKAIAEGVKNKWSDLKKKYKGPQRLKVNIKDTGRLKKYQNNSTNNFDSAAYFKDIKAKIKDRYTSKGGTRENLSQASSPNFDKIPNKYGRSLDNVRSSLSGIKKKTTADSVGSKLTKSYTPNPAKKVTRKKKGLNILGISNSSITAS